MKKVIILVIVLGIRMGYSQSPSTLYCNDRQNVAVVLPSPITSAITGTDDFVFSYNPSATDTLGLLQGKEGRPSNLFIRTKNGQLYSFLLKFKDSLPGFTYFIQNKQNTATKEGSGEQLTNLGRKHTTKTSDSLTDLICEHLLQIHKQEKPLATERKYHLILRILELHYIEDKVYVSFEIHNWSAIDFELNQVTMNVVQGNKKRKSSYQKLHLTPLYNYKKPGLIPAGKKRFFMMVYPKFTLDGQQRLQLTVDEKSGNRYLFLSLGSRKLNKRYEP